VATTTPTIFVSYASADVELAIKLKSLLEKAIGADVFCASEEGAIEGGKRWFDEIIRHLKGARVCVAVLTPKSIYYSPWVAFEAGAAYLHSETEPTIAKLRLVCAYGFTAGNIPTPFRELQIQNLANKAAVDKLVEKIAAFLGIRPRKAVRAANAVLTEAAVGSPHWADVSSALVGLRQESSPFNVLSLLKDARTNVFCAGYNLNYIATAPDVLRSLRRWLKQSSARSVRLLISDEETAQGLLTLGLIELRHVRDFRQSIETFQDWKTAVNKGGLAENQLDIRTAPLVALTVVAIDPDTNAGQMVLTPTIRPLSAERPHFWIAKARQGGVFTYYWDTYRELFRKATPIGFSGRSRR
jgi:hypothetical protein